MANNEEIKESRAKAKYLRISPRKAREVVDIIRGKGVNEALAILEFTPKKAAYLVKKVLSSAIANAENNHEMNVDNLYISRAVVDQGPTRKWYRATARGRAARIRKRSSHITIVLKEKEVS